MHMALSVWLWHRPFSALQRAENSSIARKVCFRLSVSRLSVLFSEPKIPQFRRSLWATKRTATFQCSSASRKFLNGDVLRYMRAFVKLSVLFSEPKIPQYGSPVQRRHPGAHSFSALQRAENSSINLSQGCSALLQILSVLFSEPKIPQSRSFVYLSIAYASLSVLFSEPKIPQSQPQPSPTGEKQDFQCSSASRKFLNRAYLRDSRVTLLFQCSSASRKFLNAKCDVIRQTVTSAFSALQRAENSSIWGCSALHAPFCELSVLFSEPKIPQSLEPGL